MPSCCQQIAEILPCRLNSHFKNEFTININIKAIINYSAFGAYLPADEVFEVEIFITIQINGCA